MNLTMVTLKDPITFDQDMPRKKFIHGHGDFELEFDPPIVWVQKVQYIPIDGTEQRMRCVVSEQGIPMSNLAGIARTLPDAVPTPANKNAPRPSNPKGGPAKASPRA